MQLTYPSSQAAGFAGLKVDSALMHYTDSKKANGNIDFGKGVIASSYAGAVKSPTRNRLTLTFSTDLVTSNTINGSINGTAISQVTYASSHSNTMDLIKTAIETVLTTLSLTGTVTVNATARTITVLLTGASENGTLLAASWVVAAGASQATVTPTYHTGVVFRGVAEHQHMERRSDQTVGYKDGDMVGVTMKGRIWVTVRDAVADGDDAYMTLATTGEEGDFTNVSTNAVATGGKFRSDASDNGLAILEINLP